jgi:natural product precursor
MEKKLKLAKLAKDTLSNKELNCVKGGNCCTCGCGCYWAGAGGSSTVDNGNANSGSADAKGGTVMSEQR